MNREGMLQEVSFCQQDSMFIVFTKLLCIYCYSIVPN